MGIKLTRWFTAVLVGLLAGSLCYAAMTLDQIKLTGLGGSIKAPAIVSRSFIDVPVGPFVASTGTTVTLTVSATTNYRGTIFLLQSSGVTTVKLPMPSATLKGYHYRFIATAAQNHIFQCTTNDSNVIVVLGSAVGVDKGTLTGAIGSTVDAVCDGTYWYLIPTAATIAGGTLS